MMKRIWEFLHYVWRVSPASPLDGPDIRINIRTAWALSKGESTMKDFLYRFGFVWFVCAFVVFLYLFILYGCTPY